MTTPMNHLSIRPETRQTQTITPRLQRAVRLLQMSSLDYARELHEAAALNPFLDTDDDPPHGAPAESPMRDRPVAADSIDRDSEGDGRADAVREEAAVGEADHPSGADPSWAVDAPPHTE